MTDNAWNVMGIVSVLVLVSVFRRAHKRKNGGLK